MTYQKACETAYQVNRQHDGEAFIILPDQVMDLEAEHLEMTDDTMCVVDASGNAEQAD